jgi:hypothetical protein
MAMHLLLPGLLGLGKMVSNSFKPRVVYEHPPCVLCGRPSPGQTKCCGTPVCEKCFDEHTQRDRRGSFFRCPNRPCSNLMFLD